MQETEAIARTKGIVLPVELIECAFQEAATLPCHTPTSLQLDVHADKARTELDFFADAILTYRKVLGLPVPKARQIYREIQELPIAQQI